MIPVKFLVVLVLTLEISDALYLKKSFKDLSNDEAEDFQNAIKTYLNSLDREVRLQDSDRYPVDDITGSEDTLWNVEDETQRDVDGTSEDVDDPAKEEEKLEEITAYGGDLLDQGNVNQDSTLAKMIESMIVEVNGQDKKPKGLHPESDRKVKQETMETIKYTHQQLVDMGIEQGHKNELQRNFYVGENTYWEKGIVPYTIKGSLSNPKEREIIETAIEELARKTCIQLVPKGSKEAQGLSHTTYIEFVDFPGCWSYVGRNPSGVQHISLQNPGCVDHSTVQHEILHALGMWHEQNRLDRDDYIRILKENVTSGNEFNFDKKKTSDTQPYDAESVMQYSLYSFGKEIGNTTLKTMEFVDKNLEFLADLDAGLDFYDVADITDAYQCAAHCKGSSRPKCENGGFVDHNCECFCPSGLKGDNCQAVETSQVCGGIVYVSESKITEIRTPNWPSPYPVGTKCTWLIKAPADMYIKLTEDQLSLPYNTLDRCYHWMEVRYNLIGQLGVKICGETKNRIWTTTPSGESNLMMVRFDAKFADDRDPWQGFKISATAFNEKSTPTTLPSDESTPTTLPGDSTPTTLPTTLPSDESTPTTLPTILPTTLPGDSTPTTVSTTLSGDPTLTTVPTTLPGDSTPTTVPTTLPIDLTPTTLPTTLPSDSTPTTLPSEPLTCTFEPGSDCFLMNDQNAKLTWKQQKFSTPTPGTGPYGAKEGQYYSYMESSHPAASTGQELTATFVMRNEISEAQPRCLSFYYSMHGATMGSLEVYRKGTGISKDLIFIKKGEQGSQWKLANISILPVPGIQIYIEAVRGSTHLSDIGIDDVKLTPGYCNIICTFEPEDPDCVFDLFKGDYNWDIKQGKTLSAHTGPSRAHSGQFYAYLEASDRPKGGTAVMSFKVPPMAHNEYCLSFAYNMNGGNMGELTVQNGDEIWTIKGNQGHSWKEAKVMIQAETGDLIEIVATLGYDYTSDIAVDDILMMEGVC
ncbi:uncharacterized protein LOC134719029 isoform X1 [Mytilus trossulus]|uniref:uncharacterized protein LOC134719029 isoform X1 n=2 Tax=Mytilus trossulus TaxID=6551 RepID=UPI003007073A